MIITLSGVTGAGKSYYTDYICKNVEIERLVITTTRLKRENEIEGIDKNFMDSCEIDKQLKNNMFFVAYELLGERYAFENKYLEKVKNSVTELHYTWIQDFKQKVKNVYSIYIIPKSVEIAKEQLKKRNLPREVYNKRIQEIYEQQEIMRKHNEFTSSFDNIFYNNYDEESNKKMLEIIKKRLNIN